MPNPLFTLRIPREIQDTYVAAAAEAGLTTGDWVRQALASTLKPAPSDAAFEAELAGLLTGNDLQELKLLAVADGKTLTYFLAPLIQAGIADLLARRSLHLMNGAIEETDVARDARTHAKVIPPPTPPRIVAVPLITLAIQRATGQKSIELDAVPMPVVPFAASVPIADVPTATKEEQVARIRQVAKDFDWPTERLEAMLSEIEEEFAVAETRAA